MPWERMAEMRCRDTLTGVILLTGLCAAGCATGGVRARPEPFPRPHGAEAPPVPESPVPRPVLAASSVVSSALLLRGAPYAPGGSSPQGFDCSGFVQYVFAESGIALPRTVTAQFAATSEIPFASVSAGDLLFFRTSGDQVSHVAIAIGDGTFVHAPSSRGVVRVENLASAYWRQRFDSAHRVAVNSDHEEP